jgi:hypothetical protein
MGSDEECAIGTIWSVLTESAIGLEDTLAMLLNEGVTD